MFRIRLRLPPAPLSGWLSAGIRGRAGRALPSARSLPRRGPVRAALAGFLALCSTACGAADDAVTDRSASRPGASPTEASAPREEWASLRYQGRQREYLLYTPHRYTGDQAMPLLLVLHGGHGDPRRTAGRTGFQPLADRDGFLVLYPKAAAEQWNDGRRTTASDVDDVGFLGALIDHVGEVRNVDDRRIYVTGLSNGGIMTQRLACESPDRFAAFASVIANLPVSLQESCQPQGPVPMLMMNGTADPLMPWRGGEIRKGRRIGRGGTVLSAEDSFSFWAGQNGCGTRGVTARLPDESPDDGTRVDRVDYSGCRAGSAVVLYTVEGGGHTWPGSTSRPALARFSGKTSQDIKASEVIWAFFERFPET